MSMTIFRKPVDKSKLLSSDHGCLREHLYLELHLKIGDSFISILLNKEYWLHLHWNQNLL